MFSSRVPIFIVDEDLVLNSTLDFETASYYNLTITVSDGEFSISTGCELFITDINENPVLTLSASDVNITGPVLVGELVVTSSAVDEEDNDLTFSISSNPSGPFTINSTGKYHRPCYSLYK